MGDVVWRVFFGNGIDGQRGPTVHPIPRRRPGRDGLGVAPPISRTTMHGIERQIESQVGIDCYGVARDSVGKMIRIGGGEDGAFGCFRVCSSMLAARVEGLAGDGGDSRARSRSDLGGTMVVFLESYICEQKQAVLVAGMN